jgi:hypothetical protein
MMLEKSTERERATKSLPNSSRITSAAYQRPRISPFQHGEVSMHIMESRKTGFAVNDLSMMNKMTMGNCDFDRFHLINTQKWKGNNAHSRKSWYHRSP